VRGGAGRHAQRLAGRPLAARGRDLPGAARADLIRAPKRGKESAGCGPMAGGPRGSGALVSEPFRDPPAAWISRRCRRPSTVIRELPCGSPPPPDFRAQRDFGAGVGSVARYFLRATLGSARSTRWWPEPLPRLLLDGWSDGTIVRSALRSRLGWARGDTGRPASRRRAPPPRPPRRGSVARARSRGSRSRREARWRWPPTEATARRTRTTPAAAAARPPDVADGQRSVLAVKADHEHQHSEQRSERLPPVLVSPLVITVILRVTLERQAQGPADGYCLPAISRTGDGPAGSACRQAGRPVDHVRRDPVLRAPARV
jgi:hypothetical protein